MEWPDEYLLKKGTSECKGGELLSLNWGRGKLSEALNREEGRALLSFPRMIVKKLGEAWVRSKIHPPIKKGGKKEESQDRR